MNETLRTKVTIADIARESGVSPATVSLVLRDQPGVGIQTRQRVQDTAQALGYIFKPSNQSQHQITPQNIGVILKARQDDIPTTNQFYAPVLTGIETICRKFGMNLLYANMPVDEDNHPVEIPRLLTEGKMDGLLMVGMVLDETTAVPVQNRHMPVILVDAYAPSNGYDAVVSDNTTGAYTATQYLIEKGHRHIAIVGSHPHSFPSIRERRAGYLQAINDYQLEPYFVDSHLNPDEAAQVFAEFLPKHPQVTAVFACNDDVAVAIIQAAQQCKKQLPHQLSLIGFDNIHLAQYVTPALTTMRIDKMGMGRLAAHLLLNRIEYPSAGRVRAIICPQLIERQSVCSIG